MSRQVLWVLAPSLPERGYEAFLILSDSLRDLFPSTRTILVLDVYDVVDYFVDFLLVLLSDFYSCFPENLLEMPKITGHVSSPNHLNRVFAA